MKLSEWARRQGIHYRTAWLWFRQGKLPVPAIQTPTGTILVQEPVPSSDGVALYARMSSHEQKGDLERQVARLVEWAAERKMRVVRVVKEVGSGLNGKRHGLLSLLRDPQVSVIVVEHRDRLARFGVEYIEAALSAAGRPRSTRSSPRSGRFDTSLGRAERALGTRVPQKFSLSPRERAAHRTSRNPIGPPMSSVGDSSLWV